jgi:cobaltochelatase CobS
MVRGARSAVGTVIAARYDGYCRACGATYQAGEPIRKVAPKTWHHATCPAHSTPVGDTPSAQDVPAQVTEGYIASVVRHELEGATLAVDEGEVRGMVRDELTQAGVIKHEIVLKDVEATRTISGRPPRKFERILRLAKARRNILLVGQAGSGKTYAAELVAQALGLEFSFISCSAGMSEGHLMGRLLPIGEGGKFVYCRSDFVKAYEEGGVFLLDEMDAADSNTMLVINTALANGKMAIPNRPEAPVAIKHKDFVCIAAANTFGTGADRQYVGRNQLDESTLDRFRIGQIVMEYDEELEASLCPDSDLRTRLQSYRRRAAEARLRRIISTRFLRDAYFTKQAGDTDAEIDEALFGGWSNDEINKVKN